MLLLKIQNCFLFLPAYLLTHRIMTKYKQMHFSLWSMTVLAFAAILSAGCSKADDITDEIPESDGWQTEISDLRSRWKQANLDGVHEKIIEMTRPYLQEALRRKDTVTAINCLLSIAQAYIFIEDKDSVKAYLDLSEKLDNGNIGSELSAMLDNILGIYTMKFESDYSRALEYFLSGYSEIQGTDNYRNQIAFLGNIVSIFYTQSDPNGLTYAREAWALANDCEMEDFSLCLASISMAQMLFITGETDSSACYIDRAEYYAKKDGIKLAYSLIALIDADINAMHGNAAAADSLYTEAMKYFQYAEPGTIGLCYLHYGRFCEETGHTGKAMGLYRKGIELSYYRKNVELRHRFLYHIALLANEQGETEEALDASLRYVMLNDELSYMRKTQDFNSLILKNRQMEYDNEIQAKELALLRADKKIYTSVFITAIVIISLLFVLLLYMRRNRMYRLLSMQYNNFVQRIDNENIRQAPEGDMQRGTEAEDAADAELYKRIEDLMKNGKFYSNKDISLKTLSDALDTNRTYVSRAINKYADMNFYNYINMHRIMEAARLMSSPSFDTPLKVLADELGFSSVSAFYKAFSKETGCTAARYRKEISMSMKKKAV